MRGSGRWMTAVNMVAVGLLMAACGDPGDPVDGWELDGGGGDAGDGGMADADARTSTSVGIASGAVLGLGLEHRASDPDSDSAPAPASDSDAASVSVSDAASVSASVSDSASVSVSASDAASVSDSDSAPASDSAPDSDSDSDSASDSAADAGTGAAETWLAQTVGPGNVLVHLGDAHEPSFDPTRVRLLELGQDDAMALVGANTEDVAPLAAQWRGRKLRVFTSAGAVCRGTATGLAYATPRMWRDELLEPGALVAETGALSWWGQQLVAEVALARPERCPGQALMVEDAEAGSTRLARTLRWVPQRRAVTAAFRALPAYRALVEECRRRPECPKDATTGQPEPWRLELRAFRFPGERRIHVTVSLPEAGCAQWGPGLGALFVLDGIRDRTPQLRSWTETELGVPRLMVDVERDGTLELLTSRSTAGADLELLDERGQLRRSWTTVFVGCGC